jgi:translation elongation factor EF-Tu-like GTPase
VLAGMRMMSPPRIVVLLFGLMLVLGVSNAFALEIALIGDASKRTVLLRLAEEFKVEPTRASGLLRASSEELATTFLVTEWSDDPLVVANQIQGADLALVVVDAARRPVPVVREQLIIARQARIPRVAVYFANASALHSLAPKFAADMLKSEEREMRGLMKAYRLDGERAPMLFDADVSSFFTSEYAKGTGDLRRFLTASSSVKRSPQEDLRQVSEFNGYYYLLSDPEADGHGVSLSDRSEIEVWLEGGAASGRVSSDKTHKPGENCQFKVRLSSPLQGVDGSRVLLVKKGVTVGMGVVTRILH